MREGKRAAEMLCAVHADARAAADDRALLRVRRPVSAARRALRGRQLHPRRARRTGRFASRATAPPYRSYLYAADLAVWLWTILLRGRPLRPYNVGSAEALTIRDLARLVARTFGPGMAIEVAHQPIAGVGRPNDMCRTSRGRRPSWGSGPGVSWRDGIGRTAAWHAPPARAFADYADER